MSRELIDQQKMTEQEVLDTLLEWWKPDNRDGMPGILNINIQIVEDIEIYTRQSINKEIQQACIDVLKVQQSRDDFIECRVNGTTVHTSGQYCEVERIFEIGGYKNPLKYNITALGDISRVKMSREQYIEMLKIPVMTLISVHNHPSNQGFQLQDFKQFLGIEQLHQIVVVGNHSKIFIMSKNENFKNDEAYNTISDILMNGVKDKNTNWIKYILTKTKYLGLTIRAFNYRQGVIIW